MTWASKRQLVYAAIVVGFFVVVMFLILYPVLNKPATCTDGKQNGDEVGIDCGGSQCSNYCASQVAPLIVRWARAFQVTGSTYSLMAYIENQNATAVINAIPYEFRLYDSDNQFIAMRQGQTYVTPNGRFAIFEAGVDVGNRPPKRVTFKFLDENPTWLKADPKNISRARFTTKDISVTDVESNPIMTAQLNNESSYEVPNVDVFAILYDSDDNAIAVSRSFFPRIGKNESKSLIFTWPEPFDRVPVREEIIPKFDVNAISF